MEARRDYVPGLDKQIDRDMLFADFLEDWLEVVKPTIRLSTFASYSSMTKRPIGPHFRSTKATLSGLQPWDIQNFYNKEYLGYICINEIEEIIKPTYITSEFPQLPERNGLRKIRYHDLRHSCASLLLPTAFP